MDNRFIVDSKAVLKIEEGQIHYSVKEVPAFIKKYPERDRQYDYSDYIDNPNRAIYLAYHGDRAVGQIILSTSWNNYALIEDIRVDISYRKQGIGTRLIGYAKEWAKQRGLAGLRLETQNNNIDRKSTRLNSSHVRISYAVFCLKKKKKKKKNNTTQTDKKIQKNAEK